MFEIFLALNVVLLVAFIGMTFVYDRRVRRNRTAPFTNSYGSSSRNPAY
jgi:hypothetical protein